MSHLLTDYQLRKVEEISSVTKEAHTNEHQHNYGDLVTQQCYSDKIMSNSCVSIACSSWYNAILEKSHS